MTNETVRRRSEPATQIERLENLPNCRELRLRNSQDYYYAYCCAFAESSDLLMIYRSADAETTLNSSPSGAADCYL